MAVVAGSAKECSIDGHLFQCPADVAIKLQIADYTNEVVASGSGPNALVKTRVAPMIEGLVVFIDHNQGDLKKLKEVQAGLEFVQCNVTFVDDTTYSGKVQITDAPSYDSSKGTAELKLAAEQAFEQQ